MFFKIIYNYLTGYLNIQIEGFYIERFINMCMAKSILLWNIKREKSSVLNANIAINDFRKIKKILKKTKCKVKVKKKKGLPFVFERYKKRKIFAILLCLAILLISVSAQFVWNIEIKGLKNVKQEEIAELLKTNGLSVGSLKAKVDEKKIINELRLNRDDLAWVGIDLKGTNAIVEIVEADKKPELINSNEYCDIVADKDGIITKINVQNGTALVKVGDIVKKGDVLVNGKIQGKYTEAIPVHANADIEAKVWYSKKEQRNYRQNIEENTGNEETKYRIKINNLEINLYKTLSNFEKYDTIIENKKISLFSNFYLPVEIVKITNKEKQNYEIFYGKEELKNKITDDLEKELKASIPRETNIINRYINIGEQDTCLNVEVVYEAVERIGTKEKLF